MHGKGTRVFADAYDLSTIMQGSGVAPSVDMAENTTYQSESKTYEPGLDDATLSLEAVYAATEQALIDGWVKSANGEPWTRILDGAAVGNTGHTLTGRIQAIDVPAPVGDIVKTTITVQADGGADQVISLHDVIAAETSAGNETSHDGGVDVVGIDNGGVASLHLIAFTGTSITVTVEDSANDSTWVPLATFAAKTAIGGEIVEVAEGTQVDRYLRAAWSGTFTSATFVVTFGRR